MSDLPTFRAEHGCVAWLTGRGTIYLSEAQVERLLDIFAGAEGGAELFSELYEARVDLAITPLIPTVAPLTCAIRQLDPALWGEPAATAA